MQAYNAMFKGQSSDDAEGNENFNDHPEAHACKIPTKKSPGRLPFLLRFGRKPELLQGSGPTGCLTVSARELLYKQAG